MIRSIPIIPIIPLALAVLAGWLLCRSASTGTPAAPATRARFVRRRYGVLIVPDNPLDN